MLNTMLDVCLDKNAYKPVETSFFGLQLQEVDRQLKATLNLPMKSHPIRRAQDNRLLGTAHGVLLRAYPSEHIEVLANEIRVRTPVYDLKAFEALVLAEIHGKFVVETHSALPRRLYPDSGGSVPIVYCPKTRRAGSSAGMMFGDAEYAARFLHDRHRRLIQNEGTGSWIPGTLTAHEGLFRLLPNHCLDLETWTTSRFWPRQEDFSLEMDFDEATEVVAQSVRKFVGAVAKQFRTGVTLTAGLDSRLLLAAARNVHTSVDFFTFTSERLAVDQILSQQFAKDLGLSHKLVSRVLATETEMSAWDRAVGDAVTESNRASHPSLRSLGYEAILTGLGGEMGRSFYYAGDKSIAGRSYALTAQALLAKMGCPADPDLISDLEVWLTGLLGAPAATVLDLAYVELRVGCWAMAQHPAQCQAILEFNPLVQRNVQSAFLAVRPEQKAANALIVETIRRLWPCLAEYPVNKLGDYRDTMVLLRKLVDPVTLRRFLRRKLLSKVAGHG